MFLTKFLKKSEKNQPKEQDKARRDAAKLRELQLALLDRVSGGICMHACP
jgi:hypothetical protein